MPPRPNGGLAVQKLKTALTSALALRSKEGVTAIEYGLITALISVAIITALVLLGTDLTATFNMIAGQLSNAASL
jgi:pilus assembly protein Flp/PilA